MLLIEKAPVQNPAFSCWHFTTPKQCENAGENKVGFKFRKLQRSHFEKSDSPHLQQVAFTF